jgi:thiol-disulfide isomerase/thioredoxin
MSPGLVALVAALAAAAVAGAVWRWLNGRMRRVRVPDVRAASARDAVTAANGPASLAKSVTRSIGAVGTLPSTGQPPDADGPAARAAGRLVLTSDQLGRELGDRATLVQFSSAFCAPCRATRSILADVAGMVDGVAHVEIDAESRLDLVRELKVLRTPTVLVLDRDGRIVSRGSGQPRKPQVIAALGDAMGA